jgi:hypothetical protein
MYFCAYRDLVAADLTIQRAAEERVRRSPDCKENLYSELKRIERNRDDSCAKSAAEDFGGGSMEPTARAICAAAATNEILEKMRAVTCSER